MKRPKAGPELKMPELKVPPFLVDLYWDLRDRRLLPLVALVIVAIAAAPILLGGGSKETSSVPAEVAAVPGEALGSQASSLTVVEANPGLREYSKRLAHRKPTDPFHQHYTSPPPAPGGGSELGPETASSTSSSSTSSSISSETTSTTTSTSAPEPAPSSSPSSKESGGGGATPGHLTLFAFAIDVKVTRIDGGTGSSQSKSKSSIRHGVMPTTPLPGEKAPVITYMGVGQGAKKALLMVSNNVHSIYGDAQCLSGTDTCQLLEVEPGLPETFVYGANDVRYKINVLKVDPVVAGHR
jgi:hypothetical protein